MIKVTRLNGTELVINADLIEFVEAIPDTIVSLVTGKKIMIRESTDAVIDKAAEFKRLSSGSFSPKKVDQIEGNSHG
jgi:flagellar protein FlbD